MWNETVGNEKRQNYHDFHPIDPLKYIFFKSPGLKIKHTYWKVEEKKSYFFYFDSIINDHSLAFSGRPGRPECF